MYKSLVIASLSLFGAARAQQVGTSQSENHPRLSWKTCSGRGGNSCSNKAASIVLDSNWRWSHNTNGFTNCYNGNKWDATLCPDGATCSRNCAIEGADYPGTYGITTNNDALTLRFVTKGQFSTNVGSRTYLMDSTDTKYQMFNLINNEFTFDVDVSKLPCGLNGALYFVEMAADGGINRGNNRAGAKYGTGYCDSQCPHDIKWINGAANVEGWNGSPDDPNAGAGKLGACCPEMDIWEANAISTAYTPHPCQGAGLQACEGLACGDGENRYKGICDKDGCDFNSYRMGNRTFYGPGATINTQQKMTVVTQFIGSGSSLTEIRRFYVQNGKVFKNSNSNIAGVTGNSLTDSFCANQKRVFNDTSSFARLGGMREMGASLSRGHVLVMSLWDDHAVNMLWLDSTFPTTADPNKPGIARGTCPITSGRPEDVERDSPDATVVFSNIKFGPIGSTFAQPA